MRPRDGLPPPIRKTERLTDYIVRVTAIRRPVPPDPDRGPKPKKRRKR